MTRNPLTARLKTACSGTVGLLAAGLVVAALPEFAAAQVKKPGDYGNTGNAGNVKPKEEKKPDPVVIRFQAAEKAKHMGQEVLMVTGVEVLTGRPRAFAVENEAPQDKGKPKFEPRARAKEGIDKVKAGEYLKVEPKSSRDQVAWIDRAEPYVAKEGEEEPGTFVLYDAYKETQGKTEVFKLTLVKFGAYLECYAAMVKDGKESVPDPAVVKVAEEIMNGVKDPKKKEVVEATVSGSGPVFVTSIDAYQPPKHGKFTKLTEVDVEGGKGQAVEIEQDGQAVTLPLPGKLVGKKWAASADLLSDVRKLKPGAPVVFKTRDADGKPQLRMIGPAPKEKKETAKKDEGPMLRSKEGGKK